jgi:hypothetical protein
MVSVAQNIKHGKRTAPRPKFLVQWGEVKVTVPLKFPAFVSW